GCARHAVHDGGLGALGDDDPARVADGLGPGRAVVAHPGEDDAHRAEPGHGGDAAEEAVAARAVAIVGVGPGDADAQVDQAPARAHHLHALLARAHVAAAPVHGVVVLGLHHAERPLL